MAGPSTRWATAEPGDRSGQRRQRPSAGFWFCAVAFMASAWAVLDGLIGLMMLVMAALLVRHALA